MKIVYQPQTFPQEPSKKQYQKWKDEFVGLFSALNDKLDGLTQGDVKYTYLTGDKFTLADICIYSEIQ